MSPSDVQNIARNNNNVNYARGRLYAACDSVSSGITRGILWRGAISLQHDTRDKRKLTIDIYAQPTKSRQTLSSEARRIDACHARNLDI